MLLLFNQLISFVNRYIDIFFFRRNLTATQCGRNAHIKERFSHERVFLARVIEASTL